VGRGSNSTYGAPNRAPIGHGTTHVPACREVGHAANTSWGIDEPDGGISVGDTIDDADHCDAAHVVGDSAHETTG